MTHNAFSMTPKGFISVPEFAKKNGIHVTTAYLWVNTGKVDSMQTETFGQIRHFVKNAKVVRTRRSKSKAN